MFRDSAIWGSDERNLLNTLFSLTVRTCGFGCVNYYCGHIISSECEYGYMFCFEQTFGSQLSDQEPFNHPLWRKKPSMFTIKFFGLIFLGSSGDL